MNCISFAVVLGNWFGVLYLVARTTWLSELAIWDLDPTFGALIFALGTIDSNTQPTMRFIHRPHVCFDLIFTSCITSQLTHFLISPHIVIFAACQLVRSTSHRSHRHSTDDCSVPISARTTHSQHTDSSGNSDTLDAAAHDDCYTDTTVTAAVTTKLMPIRFPGCLQPRTHHAWSVRHRSFRGMYRVLTWFSLLNLPST